MGGDVGEGLGILFMRRQMKIRDKDGCTRKTPCPTYERKFWWNLTSFKSYTAHSKKKRECGIEYQVR